MGTTVVGYPGTLVTIPFTSADNYVMNQVLSAINGAYASVFTGTATMSAYSGIESAVTVSGPVIGEGYSSDNTITQLALEGNDTFFAATNLGTGVNTVAAFGPEVAAMTVVSSANTDLIFYNYATSTTAYLGGGQNSWVQTEGTNASLYVAGSGVESVVGGAVVNAAAGASTGITLGATSFSDILIGNNTSISAVSPTAGTTTDWMALVGTEGDSTATVAATVTGASGIQLNILNTGNAFIDAGASNVMILPGSTGNTTLFGGTGADTVYSGVGYFQGGSGGSNILLSSTVAGVTTLIGGAGTFGDTLVSYAGQDLLKGGAGNDLIWDYSSAGDTLISSGGIDTLYGASSGNNTIGFGNATTDAYGDLGNASAAANVYFQNQADGTDYIFDFKTGSDKFNLNLGIGSSQDLTVNSLSVAGSSTDVTLSDGTKIVFVNNTSVSSTDFIAHS